MAHAKACTVSPDSPSGVLASHRPDGCVQPLSSAVVDAYACASVVTVEGGCVRASTRKSDTIFLDPGHSWKERAMR